MLNSKTLTQNKQKSNSLDLVKIQLKWSVITLREHYQPVVNTLIPAVKKKRQEDKFKVSLGYQVSLRSAWATEILPLQKKIEKKKKAKGIYIITHTQIDVFTHAHTHMNALNFLNFFFLLNSKKFSPVF